MYQADLDYLPHAERLRRCRIPMNSGYRQEVLWDILLNNVVTSSVPRSGWRTYRASLSCVPSSPGAMQLSLAFLFSKFTKEQEKKMMMEKN